MLKHTFCHLTRIGEKTEDRLWSAGVDCWDRLAQAMNDNHPVGVSTGFARHELAASSTHLAAKNAAWFAQKLPSHQAWRMFPDFREEAAYIDIETTGLTMPDITTIALYDGKQIKCYVNGENLDQFKKDIFDYKMIITYNGKCFDVPVIESFFGIRLTHAHIDLRYVLKKLGYSGGLKKCEQKLGISRGELDGVDGYFAVLLWQEYVAHQDRKALETLMAYNIEDVINLESLMVSAYNLNIKNLKSLSIAPISDPLSPLPPVYPDPKTIYRIKSRIAAMY